jgi:hypothetical protein
VRVGRQGSLAAEGEYRNYASKAHAKSLRGMSDSHAHEARGDERAIYAARGRFFVRPFRAIEKGIPSGRAPLGGKCIVIVADQPKNPYWR